MFTLAEILAALTGCPLEQNTSLVISEAAIDSRQVTPGGLFVALPGERTDGHDHVAEAFRAGAHIALIQRPVGEEVQVIDLRSGTLDLPKTLPEPPLCLQVNDTLKALQQVARYHRRHLPVKVVGITGSVGKSTTKELIAEVLCQRFRTLKNPGNLNNEISLPLTLLQLGEGHERAILEMGFYVPGEITLLCDLALPSIGVITNVGTVHAARAGSQEMIAKGKAELVQALPEDGTAVINIDDPWVRSMATQTKAQVFTYGLNPVADLWADDIQGLGLEGIRLRLHHGKDELMLRVPLIGRHSAHTVLRATAVGLIENLTWNEIISGLTKGHTQLRMVAVHTPQGALILDDSYNASPESMLAAMNLLNELNGRKTAILGEMRELGPYEKQGHEKVGARAAEVCQELITVGENGRLIAEAALRAGMPSERVTSIVEVMDVVKALQQREFVDGEVLLVKGAHGLRLERIVAALEEVE